MTKAISDLTNMDGTAAIDRSADFVEVSDSTGPTSYKATPNFILGITGNPVGTTDTQTLTGKTLTQPVITADDDEFTLQDNADTTKKLNFQLSGITTATTRTLTVPDANDTIVVLAATQTLTNKTLTSPTINTATITNPTLTVDTISEFSSANGVTIDGVLAKDGGLTLSGNLSVTGTSTLTGSVSTVGQLSTQTGTSIPASGSATAGIKLSSTANFGIFFGSGAPTFSAAKGSVYLRSDGSSTSTRMYVNTNGSTTWTNFTSAA